MYANRRECAHCEATRCRKAKILRFRVLARRRRTFISFQFFALPLLLLLLSLHFVSRQIRLFRAFRFVSITQNAKEKQRMKRKRNQIVSSIGRAHVRLFLSLLGLMRDNSALVHTHIGTYSQSFMCRSSAEKKLSMSRVKCRRCCRVHTRISRYSFNNNNNIQINRPSSSSFHFRRFFFLPPNAHRVVAFFFHQHRHKYN